MKILQVCKKFPWPAKDGESIAIYNLTQGFAQAGHQVTVLAMKTPKHQAEEDNLPAEVQAIADFYVVDVDSSIKKVNAFFNLFSKSSYNLERFFSTGFQEGLRRLLEGGEFDIIQLEGLYLAPYYKTIRKYTDAPIVMRAHNVEFEIWERLSTSSSNYIKKKYLQLLAAKMENFERRSLNSWSAIVPISVKDEQQFKDMGASVPMHTCPVGLPINEYSKAKPASSALNIGFLGALDWEANREGLLWFLEKVWPVIKASKPQLNLNIAGRNAPNEFVEQLPANINYVGEVDSAKEFIEEQAIMIVPLLSGSGMRIKIIEALAMGRCAVTTTVAAEGIRYKNGVDLLVEDDPIVFGEKILEVTSDEKLCKKIGSAGEKLVKEQHDIEILVSRLLAFYKQSFDI